MVVGCCAKFTKFNFTLLSILCIVSSVLIGLIGAWFYFFGASFFGMGDFQLSVVLKISGLVIGLLGIVVLALTLINMSIVALESPVATVLV